MTTNINTTANSGRDQASPKATPDLDKNNQQMKPPSQGGTSGNRDANAGQAGKDGTQTMTTPQNQNAPKPQDQNNKDQKKPGSVTDEESDDEEDDESEDEEGSAGSPAIKQAGSNADKSGSKFSSQKK